MATFAGLVPPPREVPRDVVVQLFAHRDVYWGLAFLVIAAILLSMSPPPGRDTLRTVLVIVAAVSWLLAVKTAAAHVARANRTLRMMRDGLVVPGRVVASRFAWDKKTREMPHVELLSDWVVQMGKSQVRKGTGIMGVLVFLFFGLPFMVGALVFAIVLGLGLLGDIPMDVEAMKVTAILVGVSILVVAGGTALWRRTNRLVVEHGVELAMKQTRLEQELQGKTYEQILKRVLEVLQGDGAPLSIKEPLPKDGSGVELICRVNYGVGGELIPGEGRVLFSDRLNLAGVEPLLFDPARPGGEVLFLAGLPETITVDSGRQWAAALSNGDMAALAVTALLAIGVPLALFTLLFAA